MSIIWKILNGIRYIVCLYIIFVIAVITLPLSLFFKWNGIYILAIANKECCSLLKAKELLKDGGKYRTTAGYNATFEIDADRINCVGFLNRNSQFSNYNNTYDIPSRLSEDCINNPAYSYLASNIYHRWNK